MASSGRAAGRSTATTRAPRAANWATMALPMPPAAPVTMTVSLADPVEEAAALRHDAIATVACKAAVKAHDRLGEEEAYKLLEELKDCKDGSACPHGRRAMLALNRDELARRFQRPGAVPL